MKKDPTEKARQFSSENPVTAEATGVIALLKAYDKLLKENERLKDYKYRYESVSK